MNPARIKEVLIYTSFMIATAFIAFYFFTYTHELGHKTAFSQEGIQARINISPFSKPHGITYPVSRTDCEKFNALSKENKSKIFYGGTKTDLFALLAASILFIGTFVLSAITKKLSERTKQWYMSLMLVTFVCMVVLIHSIIVNTNPAYEPSDMWKLATDFTFNCAAMFQ